VNSLRIDGEFLHLREGTDRAGRDLIVSLRGLTD
jgi:hypothetical protein